MQSMNKAQLQQAILLSLLQNPANHLPEISNIVSPEDLHKDENFIFNKYPRVAQLFLEDDRVFGLLEAFLEIEKNQPEDVRKEFWEGMDPLCHAFMKAPAYVNGNKKHNGYKICCEMADYCSFYKQTWFFIVCGAVGFLLLVGIAGVVFFIIRRKNKKIGGGNTKKGGNKA
ncbi:hypothetical protein CRE_08469 [Caenorhabditis remanei]|uniref:Uncharacterized protein n=1 Tax=Caenorhabditis remanei TaxID=31234 RepID=E3N027_CAERE|nr:hypothetical protein CRE_08469 [Caenorhabditis remanei]